MKTFLLAAIILLGTRVLTFGTAQIGEYLEFEGKRVEIYSTPLESYFSSGHERPVSETVSSGCWRGYVGFWKIEKGVLLLVSIHEPDFEKSPPFGKEFSMSKVFPNKKGPVAATWFSGVLRIPEGKELRYVHMGFGTVHERDRYISVKSGRIMGDRVVDNKGFGATRCTEDLQWVALAAEPVKDKGDWDDARLLFVDPLKERLLAGGKVTTRGIYFGKRSDDPARLWIPETPTTESVELLLGDVPAKPAIASGSHVEIEATYSKEKEAFRVSRIRELQRGESMHHPKFKAPQPEGNLKP